MIIRVLAKRYFNLFDSIVICLISIMIHTKTFSLPIFVVVILLCVISILLETIVTLQNDIKSINDF